MASENLLSENTQPKKRNARATTMLVHELPTSTEIYESFVWDPDDELVFESSSSSSENKQSDDVDLSFLFDDSSISTSGEAEAPNMNVGNDYVPPEEMNIDNNDTSSLSSSSFETPGWEQIAEDKQLTDNTQAALQAETPTTPYIRSDLARSEPRVQDSFNSTLSRLPSKAKSFHVQSLPTDCNKKEIQNEAKQEHNLIVEKEPNTVDNSANTEINIDETKSTQQSIATITQKTDEKELIDNMEIGDDESTKQNENDKSSSIQTIETVTVSEMKSEEITITNHKEDTDKSQKVNIAIDETSNNTEIINVGIKKQEENDKKENIQQTNDNETKQTKTVPSTDYSKNNNTEANDLTIDDNDDKKAQLEVPTYKPVVICVTQFKRKKRKKKKKRKDKRSREQQGRKLSVKQRERIIRKYSRAVKGTIPCPKIADHIIVEPDGCETIMPVKLVHLFVRARSHHKLNNYKNMNYASKSYQLAPELVVDALDNEKDVRGECNIDDRMYAFVKKNLCTQKEYKMALRASTNEIKHALLLLEFVESKLDEKLQSVKKITKFNHDACIQSIIAEMNQ